MDTKIEIQGLSDLADLPDEVKLQLLKSLRKLEPARKDDRNVKNFFNKTQGAVVKPLSEFYDFIDEVNLSGEFIDRKLYIPRFESEKAKNFLDALTVLKIYNKRELPEVAKFSLKALVGRAATDADQKKANAALIMLFGQCLFKETNDVHGAFRYSPEFKLLVWALGKLELPKPKNMNDFETMYPVTDINIWGSIPAINLMSLPEAQIYDRFSTPHIWETFRSFLEKFENQKLTDLDVEMTNVVKAYLFSIYRLFPFDMIILSMVKKYVPDFMDLCIPYSPYEKLIEHKELVFKSDGDIREMAMAGSTIGKSVLESFSDELAINDNLSLERHIVHYIDNEPLFIDLASMFVDAAPFVNGKIYEAVKKALTQFERPFLEAVELTFDEKLLGGGIKPLTEFKAFATEALTRLTIANELLEQEQLKDATPPKINHALITDLSDVDIAFLQIHIDQVCSKVETLRNKSMELIQTGDIESAQDMLEESKQRAHILDPHYKGYMENLTEGLTIVNDLVTQLESRVPTESQIEIVDDVPCKDSIIGGLEADLEQLATENKSLKTQISLRDSLVVDTPSPSEDSGFTHLTKKALFGRLTCFEVFALMQEQYPHVKLSDNFEKYANDCKYSSITKLLKQVQLLCDDYYLAITSGKPDSTSKDLLGHAYRANESNTVMGNDALRGKREFSFNGEKRLFTKHLTMGSAHDERKTVQVYFEIDGEDLLIAYVGSHLPLA